MVVTSFLLFYNGPDLLPHYGPDDVLRISEGEEEDGDLVVHGQGGGGGVHHPQMAGQHIVIGDAVVFYRLRVLQGVGTVYPIHILGKQNDIRVDLRRPEHRSLC